MKKTILVLLVMIFCFGSSGMAQVKYYNGLSAFSTVPAANGMGEVGVSFTGNNNFYFNPANLGLLALENKIYISGYPQKTEIYYLEVYSGGLSIPLKLNDRLGIGFAYNYSKVGYSVPVTSYEFPLGTGEMAFFGDRYHRFTLGVGYKNKWELAGGVNLTYVKEDLYAYGDKAVTFDFGLRAGYEFVSPLGESGREILIMKPSVGYSYSNVGGSLNIPLLEGGYDFDLPDIVRYGFSFELTYQKQKQYFNINKFSLLMAIEKEWINQINQNEPKYGFAVTVYELLILRIGTNDANEYDEKGFSIQLAGLRKAIQSNATGYNEDAFFNRFDIQFNYARQSEKVENLVYDSFELQREAASSSYTTYNYDYYELIFSFAL